MPWDDVETWIRRVIDREVRAGTSHLEGLEARVVRRLAHPPRRRPLRARLREAVFHREFRLGYAFALGLILVAAGFGAGRLSVLLSRRPMHPGANTFTLAAPGAREVALVGDFSAWQPITLFDHDGDGVWSVTVGLPPGRYEYAFVVDGRWVGQDPLAAEYVRTFGEYVSVRYIGGGGE
ncbi:MAG: isoamylase early set domain-containing protein [Candidatus Bipolaricaulota bacterium]|nr:isoamylase early set domain-containing protein [Candidatus Bipolaricaulota bacterium]